MTRTIEHLSQVIGEVDAVLVDQFGVLHDGRSPFPGARDCMDALHARGMPIVAVTNSGKRAALNAERLARLGFPATLFVGVVSSGELARQTMVDMLAAGTLASGSGVLILSRDGDDSVIDGLGLRPADAGEAAVVLIAGAEPERFSREDYRAMLRPLAERGVLAICANPDHVMYLGDTTAFGAGCIADDYAEMGGAVLTVGKPGAAMFRAGLDALGGAAAARTLMIGDSPAHDIAGAAAVGCKTMLIAGGVQADTNGAVADWKMERLVW